MSEGKEVNRLYEGEWKYYHMESKEIMTTENYIKGKLNGVRKVFYKNGKVAEEITYKNGIKNGSYKNILKKVIFLKIQIIKMINLTPAIYRNGLGQLVSSGQFKDGKKSGMWKYYENGKFVKEENPNKVKRQKSKLTAKIKAQENCQKMLQSNK